jgi:hypothetical protein
VKTIEVSDELHAGIEALVSKYADRYDSEETARRNIIYGVVWLGLSGLQDADAENHARAQVVQ